MCGQGNTGAPFASYRRPGRRAGAPTPASPCAPRQTRAMRRRGGRSGPEAEACWVKAPARSCFSSITAGFGAAGWPLRGICEDRQARPPSAETAPTTSSGFRDFPRVCSHRLAALMHRAGLRGETIIARSSAISMTPPLRGNPPPSLRPTLVSSRRPTGRSNSALPASALNLVLPSSRVAWPGRRQW